MPTNATKKQILTMVFAVAFVITKDAIRLAAIRTKDRMLKNRLSSSLPYLPYINS